MKPLLPICKISATIVFVCLATATVGCGNNTGLVPVDGKVVFESRDLPQVCRLTFVPVGESPSGKVRAGSAAMQANGEYELTEFQGVPGLYPGEYQVTVAYYDLKPGGNENVEADWKEMIYDLPQKLTVPADARQVDFDVVVP